MKIGFSASAMLHALLWQQRGGSLARFASASADQHDAESGVALRGSEGEKHVDGVAGEAKVVTEEGNPQRHLQAPCPGKTIKVTVKTDRYPAETTWKVINKCQDSSELMSGGPYATKGQTYVAEKCAPEGEYTFSIMDSYGDGLCCSFGEGSYVVVYGGINVANGGKFGGSETKTFGSCPDPTYAPTLAPSGAPFFGYGGLGGV